MVRKLMVKDCHLGMGWVENLHLMTQGKLIPDQRSVCVCLGRTVKCIPCWHAVTLTRCFCTFQGGRKMANVEWWQLPAESHTGWYSSVVGGNMQHSTACFSKSSNRPIWWPGWRHFKLPFLSFLNWCSSVLDMSLSIDVLYYVILFCVSCFLWTPGRVAAAFATANGDPNKIPNTTLTTMCQICPSNWR